MKNRYSKLTLGALFIAGLSVVALAQTTPTAPNDLTPRKIANATWYEIRYTDFKPGKMQEAMKIVDEIYGPARESAGLPEPTRYYNLDGQWDLTTIFPMAGGVSDLDWEVHPNTEKWMNALAQQCGGADKAKAVREQYLACVARVETAIVYRKGNANTKTARN